MLRVYYVFIVIFMIMVSTGCSRSNSDVQEFSPFTSNSPSQSNPSPSNLSPSMLPGSAKADTYNSELLLQAYESAVIEAINQNDYSLVERYVESDSQLSSFLKEYMKEQANDGIALELENYDLEQIEENDSSIKLYVRETISSKKPKQDAQSNEDYWIYTVTVQDEQEKLSRREPWEASREVANPPEVTYEINDVKDYDQEEAIRFSKSSVTLKIGEELILRPQSQKLSLLYEESDNEVTGGWSEDVDTGEFVIKGVKEGINRIEFHVAHSYFIKGTLEIRVVNE
ncbi:TcaA NTF2-like domain-containing protein [Cohnella terricola]|uniref:TcaA protein NTF2-like domain-containing protein n=1 Tax=Cohnella terricola TaxID=1289167 RepID=A0A559JAE1_9BACL|nr:hypothetical protein [Cohnella terricola]TVX96856.1 hypothetical protein FPZ45_19855 [Cohnella terricola]